MAGILSSVYRSLPVSVQNLLVSAKGVTLASKRYGPRYRRYVGELMRSQWLSAQEFLAMQTVELRRLLREAASAVPYYRDALSPISGRLDTLSLGDLGDVPLLDGALLRTSTDYFLNRTRLRHGFEEGHTSGTSGSPLVWPTDVDSMQFSMAFVERHLRWAGVTTNQRSVRFTNRVLLGRHSSSPFWRYNAAKRQLLFSVYHLREDTLTDYWAALQKFDPVYIEGSPSALFAVAKHADTHRLAARKRPRAVIVTGETLFAHQRRAIEWAFGSRVFDFYGSSEGAPVICECPSGSMHLNPESGIVEFIKPDGSAAGPGVLAEMVVTSFRQRSMPLVRYRIGDMAILAEHQSCPCGRQMPVVERIEGRESDVLRSPAGGVIGSASLSTLLYVVPSRIAESQIEQIAESEYIFRYVPISGRLKPDEEQRVMEEFRSRLGSSATVRLEPCAVIPRTAGGKVRLILGLDTGVRQSQGAA